EARPREALARVLLAQRGHVRMPEHACARDRVAREDVLGERLECGDLRLGEIAVAELVARVDELDADRARVDVARTRPEALARVPGAPFLRDEAIAGAVLVDEVMAAHPGSRV